MGALPPFHPNLVTTHHWYAEYGGGVLTTRLKRLFLIIFFHFIVVLLNEIQYSVFFMLRWGNAQEASTWRCWTSGEFFSDAPTISQAWDTFAQQEQGNKQVLGSNICIYNFK